MSKSKTISVTSQQQLDSIPADFCGTLYIDFGSDYNKAIVKSPFVFRVVARGNSSVVARGNSRVEAWENSSVEAWENSSVVACGNSQVVLSNDSAKIKSNGNSRLVHMPKTIFEYCDFYGIKNDKNVGKFYKAVHKKRDKYFSDYDPSFEYVISGKIKPDLFDDNTKEPCGHGIHISHIDYAISYGANWRDLAILEVDVLLENIVVPSCCTGKIRASEAMVVREVPLEECGVYGKIIKKRLGVKLEN